jgi:hypothetical protein
MSKHNCMLFKSIYNTLCRWHCNFIWIGRRPSRGTTVLSAFEEYCIIWKLTVNTNKTKIVVFNKKKNKTNVVFKIYGQAIDLQDSYSYLGVIFNYNRNFCAARKKLLDQANKTLYALYRKIRNLSSCTKISIIIKYNP